MPLRHEPEVSHADWFVRRGEPWARLCSFGPSGFERYARLFHADHAADDASDPYDLVNVEGQLDADVLERLVAILANHSTTPQDCFFALWEGFDEIHGSPSVTFTIVGRGGSARSHSGPVVPPAFPPFVLYGPRVSIPNRSYLLFRGPLDVARQWGALDLLPGHPRPINSPNLIWPADHSWFVPAESTFHGPASPAARNSRANSWPTGRLTSRSPSRQIDRPTGATNDAQMNDQR